MTPIKETLDELLYKKEPLSDQAKRLFPDHPKAQDVWVILCTTGSGGVMEVVKAIGLKNEYESYSNKFDACVDRGLNREAADHLTQFRKFCQQQVLDNYHKFV